VTEGTKKGTRHGPSDEHRIHPRQKAVDHVDLSRNLRATEDCHERTLRVSESAPKMIQLAFHQQAGDGWSENPRNAFS
jgi:hypothetical protein